MKTVEFFNLHFNCVINNNYAVFILSQRYNFIVIISNHINICNSNRVKDYNTLLLLHNLES